MANEILNIVTKVNNAIRSKRALKVAINTVFSIHKARIFEKGLDGNDSKIGSYSITPIRIPKTKQARNTGKTYFQGGYSEYKTAIGKNPGFVNLRNFDQLSMDYGVIQNGADFALGFQNEDNGRKAGYITDQYNDSVFHHTQKEIDLLGEVIAFELNKI